MFTLRGVAALGCNVSRMSSQSSRSGELHHHCPPTPRLHPEGRKQSQGALHPALHRGTDRQCLCSQSDDDSQLLQQTDILIFNDS